MIAHSFNLLANKYRKKIIIPVSVFLSLLFLLQLYFVFEITVRSNDECIWLPQFDNEKQLILVFQNVKENGVTWQAGIRDGDTLLEINHKKITDVRNAQLELNKFKSGEFAHYRVIHDGQILDTNVEVKKLINFGGLAFALFGGIWLLISAIVLTAKPDGEVQIIFYRIGSTLVLLSSFNLLIDNFNDNPISSLPSLRLIFDLFYTFGAVFIGFLLVHLFWVFPQRLRIIERKWTKKILYLTPLSIFVIVVLLRAVFVYFGKPPIPLFFRYIETLYLIFISAGIAISLSSLFINYYNLKTKAEKNTVFVILVAYSITAASFVYNFVVNSTLNPALRYNSPEFFMPIILIATLPIAFGYSIFKYSLMDMSEVVKRTLTYGLATVAVAVLYFLVIYILGQTISGAIGTDYQAIIAGAVFIIFAFIFQSTKDRFQETITRKFYPEQFAYQKVILNFSKEVGTITGLKNILSVTTQVFTESLNIKKFGIAIHEKENHRKFRLLSGFGLKENFCFQIDIAAFAKFLLTKKDLNTYVVIEKENFENIFLDKAEKFIENEIYTIIPMQIQSRLIGFLLFGLKYSGSKFVGQDLELLTAAANQVAMAIENARLYEAEKEKLILERDLENARLIQLSLLPKIFPKIQKIDLYGTMIPAMQVGGDYYDMIKVSESKLFVVIGDVSGKGLSASLYMSKLQTMFQLYASSEFSPKEILIKLNENIFQQLERNWFITSSIALFDLENKKVKFARAGHTPLSVVTGNVIKEIKPAGIGLGLEGPKIFNHTLEEVEYDFKTDDVFAFYSDGITEAMDETNQLFGIKKFHQILLNNKHNTCKNISDAVLQGIENHRGEAMQNDDLTLVILKVV